MKHLLAAAVLIIATGASLAADPQIYVVYRDKPPYSYTKDAQPAGFLIERTLQILQLAGITADYEELPVKRITRYIQENQRPVCSPGWYKLPEREAYARFSLPIHQDRPHLVLAGGEVADVVRAGKTLKALMANPDLRIGTVSGVSYGAELDALIATAAQAPMETTISPLGMARMIRLRRADYMLIDEEDYKFLNSKGEVDAEGAVVFRFADMPPGLKRYIMCSKSVPSELMDRIDKAITQVPPGMR